MATLAIVVAGNSICGGQEQLAEVAEKRSQSVKLDSIGDPLPDNALARFGTLRFQHPSSVIDLALSPNGKTLISIGSNELVAWDTETGKQLWLNSPRQLGIQLPGAAYGVRSIVFAEDSSRFYAVRSSDTVLEIDVTTGDVREIKFQNCPNVSFARSLDVTRDGKRFAIGGPNGVNVCSVNAGFVFQIPNDNSQELTGIDGDRLLFGGHYSLAVFSPAEDRLAVVTSDSPKAIRLFDAVSGEESMSIPLSSWLVRLAFSPDGKYLVATERDSSVRVYDTMTGESVWTHSIEIKNNAESYTSGIAYSPDGQVLAVAAPIGSDYNIHLFDALSGESLRELAGHTWKPWALAFDADGRTLYSAGWDGPIRRWDVRQGIQLPLPVGIRASSVVAASPTDRSVAFADDVGGVHVVSGGQLKELNFWNRRLNFDQLAFSPDGRWLATGGSDQDRLHVELVDLQSTESLHEWSWDKGPDPHSSIESLEFSPDGSRLAVAVFRQSQALVWDLETGEELTRLPHKSVYGLCFDAGSQRLVTAGWDRFVRQWDARDGTLISEHNMRELTDGQGDLRMYTVCCSPAGDILATAHLDGRVRLWNQSDFSLRGDFKVDGRFIYGSMAFSPDGLWLATGQMNGSVEIFDPYTGSQAYKVGTHEHYAYTVEFGSNNRTLVSGGSDEVSYLWDVVPSDAALKSAAANDFAKLWGELGDTDSTQAYRAYWQLIKLGDDIVQPMLERLQPIKSLIDMPVHLAGLSADDVARRKRLTEMLVAKDDSAELITRAMRGVSVLGHVNNEASYAALAELQNSQVHSKISQAAKRWLSGPEIGVRR